MNGTNDNVSYSPLDKILNIPSILVLKTFRGLLRILTLPLFVRRVVASELVERGFRCCRHGQLSVRQQIRNHLLRHLRPVQLSCLSRSLINLVPGKRL